MCQAPAQRQSMGFALNAHQEPFSLIQRYLRGLYQTTRYHNVQLVAAARQVPSRLCRALARRMCSAKRAQKGGFNHSGILVEVNAGRAHAVLQASTHPKNALGQMTFCVQRAQQDSFRSTCCSPVQRAQSAMGAVPESTRQSRVQTSLPMCA